MTEQDTTARTPFEVLDEIAACASAKASAENFPVALRLLPRVPRDRLLRLYAYARFVDDVGDQAPGDRIALLDEIAADVLALWSGSPRLSVVAALRPLVDDCGVPPQPLLDLIEANRLDQTVGAYETFDDLISYCRYSARPVGRVVLHIANAVTDANLADSDTVCDALQVLEHCQDVAEDARAGRIYLPGADLRAEGVKRDDLTSTVASPALRRVVKIQVDRAVTMLDCGRPLVRRLHGWPKAAVGGYVGGGLATARALRRARYESLAQHVGPAKLHTARFALRLLLAVTLEVRAAYRACERITGRQARNFAWGIRLLPGPKRRALSAVYAMSRRIDDICDGDLSAEEKLTALTKARRDATEPTDGSDPVQVALRDAASRFPIPLSAFGELVDGCEMDVTGRSYGDLSDLVDYCRCVAGSIGRLSLAVFNPPLPTASDRSRASQLANTLGIALQLTNILRDVREDLLGGRSYLPKQDLDLFAVELRLRDDGSIDPQDGRVAELVRFEAARAWGRYDEGLRLVPLLDRRSAACCGAMAGIYRELLSRIARNPSLVLGGRASLPARDKLRVAAGAVVRRG